MTPSTEQELAHTADEDPSGTSILENDLAVSTVSIGFLPHNRLLKPLWLQTTTTGLSSQFCESAP